MNFLRKMKINRKPTTTNNKGYDSNVLNSYWKEFSVNKEVSLNASK